MIYFLTIAFDGRVELNTFEDLDSAAEHYKVTTSYILWPDPEVLNCKTAVYLPTAEALLDYWIEEISAIHEPQLNLVVEHALIDAGLLMVNTPYDNLGDYAIH